MYSLFVYIPVAEAQVILGPLSFVSSGGHLGLEALLIGEFRDGPRATWIGLASHRDKEGSSYGTGKNGCRAKWNTYLVEAFPALNDMLQMRLEKSSKGLENRCVASRCLSISH